MRIELHKIKFTAILLLFVLSGIYSQKNTNSVFNSSYWNAYADKIQLQGKDRIEFISSHERLNSPAPIGNTFTFNSSFQPSANKSKLPPNLLMAGPCVNADFEAGNLTGWTPTSGFHPGFNITGCCPNGGGQQLIMSGGLDPFGGFPVVFPGGNFSLRLGNPVNGGEADRIEQTFMVSPANANFSYKYAVVLEDPNHAVSQQPSFQVEMLDSTGAQIPCTYFYVAAGQGIPGFFNSPTPGVIYKPWTTVLVDLTPYIGQNVTIRFTTFDCSLGGHFGYAYIDGVCQSFPTGGSYTICAGSTQTICAPAGLASYTWNGPGVNNVNGQCAGLSLPGIYTVQTTLITNCNGPTFTYTVSNQPAPIANAGPNATVCANNSTIVLNGSINGFSSTPQWLSGGSGVFTSTSNLTTTYTPSNADILAGIVNFTLSTLNNGFCPPATSTLEVIILPSPIVNAGTDQTICATASAILNGTVIGPSNTGSWTSTGSGTFTPSQNILNPTYIPSINDITTGSVSLILTSTGNQVCLPESDTMNIFFQTPPLANAGPNASVCANNASLNLSGSIVGFTGTPQWSSSGSGVFTSTSNINTTYLLSGADILSGNVIITLSTLNNGVCPPSTSTLQIIVTPSPVVNAASNQTICSTGNAVLSGTVLNQFNTGIWSSSGSGTFSPFPTFLNCTYNPSNADILAGNVTLSLTSTGNGNCLAVTSTVNISIVQIATVIAGPPHAICNISPSINLTGTITGGTSSGIWTSNGSGTYNPGPTTVNNNTYFVSPGDISQGTVIYTLTSLANGPCPAVSDTTMLSIVLAAFVYAGPNQFVCSNNGTIALNGNVNPPFCAWSSNGSGFFIPNIFTANASYSPSLADINAGTVTFTFSSTNNGICPMVIDTVMMRIQKIASVNSGSNVSLCASTGTLNLNGTVTDGSGTGLWTTNGTGAFTPGPNFLNTTYFISFADVNNAAIIFTLTSPAIGPCPAVQDSLLLTIYKTATVSAGPNLAICSNAGTFTLSGSVNSSSNTGMWLTNGSGPFLPDNLSMNPTYSITASDINTGSVTFTLSSTNNGPCPAGNDTVKVSIKRIATVNAGADKLICSTTTLVALSGTVGGGSSTGIWNSSGNGTFTPGTNFLNTSYKTSTTDISNGLVYFILSSQNNGVCPVITDSVILRIMKLPVIKLAKDTTVCSNQNPLTLSPNITGDFTKLLWITLGNGSFLPDNASNPVQYDLTKDIPSGYVKINLTAITDGPCGEINASIEVTIRPTPIADFLPSKTIASYPNDPVTFTNKSTNATKYSWDFGDGSGNNYVNPVHNFTKVGFYTVTLIAMNQYGCSDTAVKEIKVESNIEFPNVFTPDPNHANGGIYNINDYSNNVFFPYTTGVTEYNLKIFNRWGELIFESNDVDIGWDGYFNGKLCQQDGYVWKADVKFFDGKTYNKTGSVTLLR